MSGKAIFEEKIKERPKTKKETGSNKNDAKGDKTSKIETETQTTVERVQRPKEPDVDTTQSINELRRAHHRLVKTQDSIRNLITNTHEIHQLFLNGHHYFNPIIPPVPPIINPQAEGTSDTDSDSTISGSSYTGATSTTEELSETDSDSTITDSSYTGATSTTDELSDTDEELSDTESDSTINSSSDTDSTFMDEIDS